MYQLNQLPQKRFGLIGTIFGGLLMSIPLIPQAVVAQQPTSKVNPCPSIFYEEPHNHRVMVPQGCPPNAATLGQTQQGQMPGMQGGLVVPIIRRPNVIQPPLPQTRQNAIATVMPMAGKVDVKLKNNTNARISYQAIAHTQPRILTGREEVVLKDLPTPVTITMVREDGGLLKVMPLSTSDSGVLAVSLDEKTTSDNNQGVLRIQRDGQVFLN